MMGYQVYDSWYVGAGPFLRIYEVEPTLDAQINMILGSGTSSNGRIRYSYSIWLCTRPDDKWIFTMSTGIHYTF